MMTVFSIFILILVIRQMWRDNKFWKHTQQHNAWVREAEDHYQAGRRLNAKACIERAKEELQKSKDSS
jgi:hypothetical protein